MTTTALLVLEAHITVPLPAHVHQAPLVAVMMNTLGSPGNTAQNRIAVAAEVEVRNVTLEATLRIAIGTDHQGRTGRTPDAKMSRPTDTHPRLVTWKMGKGLAVQVLEEEALLPSAFAQSGRHYPHRALRMVTSTPKLKTIVLLVLLPCH